MTAIVTHPTTTARPSGPDRSLARTTGLLYLAVGVAGMLSYLLVRAQLFDAESPAATLGNLLQREGLARAGVALELSLVVAQVLVALWFYLLFRAVDQFAAATIAVFGSINGILLAGSAAFLGSALDVAHGSHGELATQQMYLVSENLWTVGNVFFGLWLVPMGLLVLRSRWAPAPLGWFLVIGGPLYVLTPFLTYLAPSLGVLTELLVVPATIGELWMIGWLLWRGLRRG